jgi:Anti-sigma-K factor rskA
MTNQLDNSATNWSELLAGYALDDLSNEEVIALQEYLATHPDALLEEVTELQNTLALMPLGLTDVMAPPIDLKAKILAAAAPRPVEEVKKVIAITPPVRLEPAILQPAILQPVSAPTRSAKRRSWLPIAGGIAAAAIAALGVQSYRLQQEIAQLRQTMVAQQTNGTRYQQAIAMMNESKGRMLNLSGSGAAAGATGNVVVSTNEKRAMLMIQKMPPAPPGKVYHLWAMVDGNKVSCIQFTPEADGQVLLQLPADRWNNAVGVVITIEPEKSDTKPSGEMIMSDTQI